MSEFFIYFGTFFAQWRVKTRLFTFKILAAILDESELCEWTISGLILLIILKFSMMDFSEKDLSAEHSHSTVLQGNLLINLLPLGRATVKSKRVLSIPFICSISSFPAPPMFVSVIKCKILIIFISF